MIRFIINRRIKDRMSGLETSEFETVDCDAPELERVLLGGGMGQDSYDYRALFGAEVLPASADGEAERG